MKKTTTIFKIKLKVKDEVIVLLGKDRGKKGKIEKIFPRDNLARVAGINLYKKHLKKRGQAGGGIIEMARPLAVSKIALICPKCQRPTKIGYRFPAKKRVRFCRKCKEEID